jgi:hypothetical protein
MHNTVSSPSLSAIGTGIVPPPMYSPPTQYMQSTTPSAANGKDEIRGWLYKWTNVNQTPHPLYSNKYLSFYLVFKRLSKTLVCFTSWCIIILSFTR